MLGFLISILLLPEVGGELWTGRERLLVRAGVPRLLSHWLDLTRGRDESLP